MAGHLRPRKLDPVLDLISGLLDLAIYARMVLDRVETKTAKYFRNNSFWSVLTDLLAGLTLIALIAAGPVLFIVGIIIL